MELASSVGRVPLHTADSVNEVIRQTTERSISRYRNAAPEEIDRRLQQLDYEWDVERAIETNAALFSLGELALAALVNRRWLALPAAVSVFLLQHSLQGWCPPLPVLRRLGFRTSDEIQTEREALQRFRKESTSYF